MKKNSVKIMSLFLAASFVLPIAACNKKGSKAREKSRSGQKITADSPWFDSNIVKIEPIKPETQKGKKRDFVYGWILSSKGNRHEDGHKSSIRMVLSKCIMGLR